MKSFFKFLTMLFNSIAEARTASSLAKLGKYDQVEKAFK